MANDFAQLWDQIEHDLGFNDHNMRRDRPYNGQPHTDTGIRGATEVHGITFRDLRDCFIRAVLLSTGAEKIGDKDMRPLYEEANKGENAALCENDLYGFDLDRLDPMAICQNLCCEVERVMGIYPNVPELRLHKKEVRPPMNKDELIDHTILEDLKLVHAEIVGNIPFDVEKALRMFTRFDQLRKARSSLDAELVEALEKVAFMGLDAAPGADLEYFYRSQLCACISIAANALAKHKGKD